MQPSRHSFQCEETMARSHQRGTIRLEQNLWVGNLKVLDPITGELKWRKQRVGVLGAKSKMTKHQAQDSLDERIAQRTGGTTQPRADERIVTLGWFARNRFFPLREGSTWKEGTAVNRKTAIEKDILAKLGDMPMAQIDKFMLQTHLNRLAQTLSAGRVMHARFYMKAIFEGDRSGIHPEKSRPKADRAERTAACGQDDIDVGTASVAPGVGTASGSHSADPGHDGDVPAKRAVCSSVERLRHGQEDAYGQADRVSRQASRLWQDQEVVADGARSGRIGKRSVALAPGVPGSEPRSLHLSQFAQAQRGNSKRLHPHGELPRPCADRAGERVSRLAGHWTVQIAKPFRLLKASATLM
jgi:hypothetical protein